MNMPRFTVDEIVRVTRASHHPPDEAGGRSSKSGDGAAACSSISTDSRSIEAGGLFFALSGPNFDGHDFLTDVASAGAFGAVVRRGSESIPKLRGRMHLFEVDEPLISLGGLARLYRDRFPSLHLAAVTGSNGKTTTKEMLASVLSSVGRGLKSEGNFNNRIGVPWTLFRLRSDYRWAVIEMGMNEPGEIADLAEMARPAVGLVTTASAMHLEGLGGVDAVARAKAELYESLPDGAVAVVNLDDLRLPSLAESAGAIEAGGRLRRVTYGLHPRADVRLGDVEIGDDCTLRFQILVGRVDALLPPRARSGRAEGKGGPTILQVRLRLLGRHNAHNACGALATALAMGVQPEQAAEALADMPGLPRRLEMKPGPGGSVIIDDCYNAGPASVRAALQTSAELAAVRGGRLFAILGDMLELGEREDAYHREMGRAAVEFGAKLLVTFGDRSAMAGEAAREAGLGDVAHEDAPEPVMEHVREAVRPKDVILVKGSRGLAMERIADPLTEAADENDSSVLSGNGKEGGP